MEETSRKSENTELKNTNVHGKVHKVQQRSNQNHLKSRKREKTQIITKGLIGLEQANDHNGKIMDWK